MKNESFYYLFVNINSSPKYIKDIHLSKIKNFKTTGWTLSKGDQNNWICQSIYKTKNQKLINIKINENLYNKLLSLSSIKKSYINNTDSEVKLFDYWGILDEIGDQLI